MSPLRMHTHMLLKERASCGSVLYLVPDKGIELEDDWPGVPNANPV